MKRRTEHLLPKEYPPLPISVTKFLILNGLQEGYDAKFLSVLDLAADSSQQRSCRRILGRSELFGITSWYVLFVGRHVRALHELGSSFNCAPVGGNSLQDGVGVLLRLHRTEVSVSGSVPPPPSL